MCVVKSLHILTAALFTISKGQFRILPIMEVAIFRSVNYLTRCTAHMHGDPTVSEKETGAALKIGYLVPSQRLDLLNAEFKLHFL